MREDGVKELLAVEDGYRESTDSWAATLRNLRDRGLNEPKPVTGDGALGAWAPLRDVFPGAGEQRCWVHKIANVLDAMRKRLQPPWADPVLRSTDCESRVDDPSGRRAPAGIARQAGWEAVQAAANAVGVRMASAE